MSDPKTDKPLHLRLIVGVDERGLAIPAVERGLDLALHHSDKLPLAAKLRIVHIVRLPPPLWPGLDDKELTRIHSHAFARIRESLTRGLRPAFERAGLDGGDLEQVLEVLPGRPVDGLLRYADEFRANLLLLGPHAERGMFDFGSTARGVLSRTQVPAWNQVGPPEPVRSILVPVDFSTCSEGAITYARSLAGTLGASVRLLHCMAPPAFGGALPTEEPLYPTYVIEHERKHAQELLQELVTQRDWGTLDVEPVFVEGDPSESILEQAQDADLVVMGKRGHSRLSRLLLGNVAYGVLKRSTTPVLAVPEVRRSWFGDGHLEAAPAAVREAP